MDRKYTVIFKSSVLIAEDVELFVPLLLTEEFELPLSLFLSCEEEIED